jgi:threonine/homoserine/homoserine lactone efflux protein
MLTLKIVSIFAVNVFLLALMPGPDNIFVAIQSLSYGKKHGLATVLGLVSGCLVHTLLVAFGVSALIKNSEFIYSMIIVFGATYLFYLAYKVYGSEIQIDLNQSNAPKLSLIQSYKKGVVMNVLNPKVGIFFLAFFPAFLFSNSISVSNQFIFLGLVFALITFIVFSTIALMASMLHKFSATNSQLFWIKWIQISVFILIAFYILWSHFYSYF